MAFTADTQESSGGFRIFTGLANFKPVMVNPTLAELEVVGINFKEEPSYVTESDGKKKVRVDIWGQVNAKLNSEEVSFLQKLSFFIENGFTESQAGNKEFINDYGDSCWAKSLEEIDGKYTWFQNKNIRQAYPGEPLLISFIKRWLSIGRNSIAKFDNITKLVNGDVSELRTLVNTYKTKEVQVLLTVREYEGNYYQNIYNKYFGIPNSTNVKYWKKHLDEQTNKTFYQETLLFKEFNQEAQDSSETSFEESIWGS